MATWLPTGKTAASPKAPKFFTPDEARGELTGDRKTDMQNALGYGAAVLPWLPAIRYESDKLNSKKKAAAALKALNVGAPKADPTQTNQEVAAAMSKARRFAYGSYGRSDTIVTGPKGLTTPAVKPKTLIGY